MSERASIFERFSDLLPSKEAMPLASVSNGHDSSGHDLASSTSTSPTPTRSTRQSTALARSQKLKAEKTDLDKTARSNGYTKELSEDNSPQKSGMISSGTKLKLRKRLSSSKLQNKSESDSSAEDKTKEIEEVERSKESEVVEVKSKEVENVDKSPVDTSPAKRLLGLIGRLSERTSPESSRKRPRRNSFIFHESPSKRSRVESQNESSDSLDSDPDYSIEITETDKELSNSERQLALAVARILNLETEIVRLRKRFRLRRIAFTDESVRTYTGLPSLQVFELVFDRIKPMVLKIRCRKDRHASLRICRKYRRMRKEFVRTRRLNLKHELMIALIHAKHDYDVRDTASRYAISVAQCKFILKFWMSFLPFELEKALLSLAHLLPQSKWTKVPEYSPSIEKQSSFSHEDESKTTGTKWTVTPKSNGLRLVLKNPDTKNRTIDSPELLKLFKQKPRLMSYNHDALFSASGSYLCRSCCLYHDSSLELLEHCPRNFGCDYDRLRQQLADVRDIVDDPDEGRVLKCCVCAETRNELSDFLSHMKRHMDNRPFSCAKCHKYFTRQENFDRHNEHFHPPQQVKYFCSQCCLLMETKEAFQNHVQQHSKTNTVENTGKRPVEKVGKLSLAASSGNNEINNTVKILPKLAPKPTSSLVSSSSELMPVNFQPILYVQPTFESESSQSEIALVEEKPDENGIGRVRRNCEKCSKVFYSKTGLDLHRLIHTETSEERIKCPYCPRTFAHKVTLKVHMTKHTGEKPHKCQHCSKSFYRKNDLFNHERIHTGEKPYSCQYCGAKFAHSCSLAAHVRLSCHKIPSQCEICGFVAEQRGQLDKHMKTHASECKFHCNSCGKNFSTRHHLDQHRVIHRPKLGCTQCKSVFRSQTDLDSHMKTHVKKPKKPRARPKKPIVDHVPNQCYICQRWFTRRSDLKRHIRRVHNVDDETMKREMKAKREEELAARNQVVEDDSMDGLVMNPLIIAE